MIYSERGMTLLETLVVVAIMAAMVLVAIPDFAAWRAQTIYRSAASELLEVMRLARSRAISRNLEQRVEIEVLNRRYRLMEGNRPAQSSAFTKTVVDWTALPGGVLLKRNLACDSDADRTLEFNPNGTSQSGYVCIMDTNAPEVFHFKVGVSSSYVGRPKIRTD